MNETQRRKEVVNLLDSLSYDDEEKKRMRKRDRVHQPEMFEENVADDEEMPAAPERLAESMNRKESLKEIAFPQGKPDLDTIKPRKKRKGDEEDEEIFTDSMY